MKNKGFTLVEVLIGLSIATVAAVSIAYTIANTNKIADAGKKTFIATNLAHEGLELTRAMRDNAWFIDGVKPDSDWAAAITGELDDNINKPIKFDPDPTQFTRHVTVTPNDEHPESVDVTSTVDWNTASGETKSIELKEKLYNWYVAPKP